MPAAIFLSTLPAWGATRHPHRKSGQTLSFLSTLPAWGATIAEDISLVHLVISIHAPRVGSDKLVSPSKTRSSTFLSTLPAWGATVALIQEAQNGNVFLSTLPAWGATVGRPSRHLPSANFYPRSPRGERHHVRFPSLMASTFLSTLPAWGAT